MLFSFAPLQRVSCRTFPTILIKSEEKSTFWSRPCCTVLTTLAQPLSTQPVTWASRSSRTVANHVLWPSTPWTSPAAETGGTGEAGWRLMSPPFFGLSSSLTGETYNFSSTSPAMRKKKPVGVAAKIRSSSPWGHLLCFFTSLTPAKQTSGDFRRRKKHSKHQSLQETHFTSRCLSNRNLGCDEKEDGRGTFQRANGVTKVWAPTCLSCFPAPNSLQTTVLYMISGCVSANSNWITGSFFHQSTTPGTAEAFVRGPWASSMAHQSTQWCRTSYMRSLTPLCPGPHVFLHTTARWASWSLKRTAPMSTRSLKTWLLPGARVAKPATNVSFFSVLRAEWNISAKPSYTVITVSDTLTRLGDFMGYKIFAHERSLIWSRCVYLIKCVYLNRSILSKWEVDIFFLLRHDGEKWCQCIIFFYLLFEMYWVWHDENECCMIS